MKIRRRVLFITAFIIVVISISIYILGYPLVFDFSNSLPANNVVYQKGEMVSPLKNFTFEKGNWTAYIIISNDDESNLSEKMPQGKIFKTTDKILLREMQNEWKFTFTGGDIATVTSYITIYQNENKVFESGIILDKSSQGLQSRQFGYLADTDKLLKSCSKFKKVYFPLVILN